MQDLHEWRAEERAAAKAELQFYKDQLRALIRSADLYHLTSRPDGKGWDAVEYLDLATHSGAIYVFHGSDLRPVESYLLLQGLDAERSFRLQFRDHPEQNRTISGRQLLTEGLRAALPLPYSSEIVLFRQVAPDPAGHER